MARRFGELELPVARLGLLASPTGGLALQGRAQNQIVENTLCCWSERSRALEPRSDGEHEKVCARIEVLEELLGKFSRGWAMVDHRPCWSHGVCGSAARRHSAGARAVQGLGTLPSGEAARLRRRGGQRPENLGARPAEARERRFHAPGRGLGLYLAENCDQLRRARVGRLPVLVRRAAICGTGLPDPLRRSVVAGIAARGRPPVIARGNRRARRGRSRGMLLGRTTPGQREQREEASMGRG